MLNCGSVISRAVINDDDGDIDESLGENTADALGEYGHPVIQGCDDYPGVAIRSFLRC